MGVIRIITKGKSEISQRLLILVRKRGKNITDSEKHQSRRSIFKLIRYGIGGAGIRLFSFAGNWENLLLPRHVRAALICGLQRRKGKEDGNPRIEGV